MVIKRVLDEAWNRVNQFGCIFLQYPIHLFESWLFQRRTIYLTRYAIDKIILMELARELMEVQTYQNTQHRPGFGITIAMPLVIGQYMLNSIYKAKAMEVELQLIILMKSKARFDFNYWGMHSKIKRAFTHVRRMEDI